MTDDYPTPDWLKKYFEDWSDPCPLNPTFDGLEVYWPDQTFANIPYSNPLPWVEKAIKSSMVNNRVVLLVRVDTSTKWWLKLVECGARFAFFHGRIKFTGKGSPPFASALVFL